MTTDYLYHYTSVEVLKLMLDKMKDDGSSCLTFWASNIHYMNDPHEMEFLYDELVNILPDVEKELEITTIPYSALSFSGDNDLEVTIDRKLSILTSCV